MPAAVLWKVLIWNWAGLKNKALHFTLGACIFTALKLPKLLLEREPVSLSTIRKVMVLRKKSIRRVTHE